MLPLRKELQSYSKSCEILLSAALEPELTDEEKDLIVYYADELLGKFDHHRNGQARFARA